jgi:hypothetical protein
MLMCSPGVLPPQCGLALKFVAVLHETTLTPPALSLE